MAFMMPVMKNDWDIYNSRRSSESAEKVAGRVRKVSESRSEGQAAGGARPVAGFSPHRSAPAMRSLSYCRAPPSRVSLRDSPASPPPATDKIHTRARAQSPPRRSGCACMPYL